jgi:hypothetical protein
MLSVYSGVLTTMLCHVGKHDAKALESLGTWIFRTGPASVPFEGVVALDSADADLEGLVPLCTAVLLRYEMA